MKRKKEDLSEQSQQSEQSEAVPSPLEACITVERMLRGKDAYYLCLDRTGKRGLGDMLKRAIFHAQDQKRGIQCCKRDTDYDGNCDRHKPLAKEQLQRYRDAFRIVSTGQGLDGSRYSTEGLLNQAAWIGENAWVLIREIERLRPELRETT